MLRTCTLIAIGLAFATMANAADTPFHQRIDQLWQPSADGIDVCSDAEFYRRVSLDLTGMPPSTEELRQFLDDASENKRAALVDRLLESPQYVRHLASTLDLMLMERRPAKHVSQDEWAAWLMESVRQNKPWNLLAKEILAADGDTVSARAAARFYLDREAEPNLLTRDIGRIFFGRDMQCAQCHNHPLVDNYLQSDYHGLLAFVAPGYAVQVPAGDKKKKTVYGEKAGGDLEFESVFVKGTLHRTGPRLPDGVALVEPSFLPGEEYEIAPADNVKAVPKFSRRAQLAELATNGGNAAFNENIVNRLWAQMLGRGLVHPPDMHHPDNPPTHPELLRALAEHFAATNFDMRGLLREIALSKAYQRPFDAPADVLQAAGATAANVESLEAQRAALDAAMQQSLSDYSKAINVWHEAEETLIPALKELDASRKQYADAKAALDKADAELKQLEAKLAAKQDVAASVKRAAEASQAAAAMLKDEAELAAAAQTFVKKHEQLAGEVAAIQKSVDEKAAANAKLVETLAAAKQTVDERTAAADKLRQVWSEAEAAMLPARQRMEDAVEAQAAHDERLATARSAEKLADLKDAIGQAEQAIADATTHVEAVQMQVANATQMLRDREATKTSAEQAATNATATLAAARTELSQRTEVATAVEAAVSATVTAQEKLPDDTVLAEAATKLKERAAALQSQVDAQSAVVEDAATKAEMAKQALADATEQQEAARAALEQQQQALTAANEAVAQARTDRQSAVSAFHSAEDELIERWSADSTLASLKPLTPEQFCWSVFRVTGLYQRTWDAAAAELDKASPLTDEQKQQPEVMAARAAELEQKTYEKLKGHVATFVTYYGAAPGQPQTDFFATADQALFAGNGGTLNSWVAPSGDNPTAQALAKTEPPAIAAELYLGILSRQPTADEVTKVQEHLAARGEENKSMAIQELAWAMLNSAEFRFNH